MERLNTFHDYDVSALVNMMFILVGICYVWKVLEPIPKTYLSEIAFPFDFLVKTMCSTTLALIQTIRVGREMLTGHTWGTLSLRDRLDVRIASIAWIASTSILFMEHRRSRTPSLYLRSFWMFTWIQTTYTLFYHESVMHFHIQSSQLVIILFAATIYTSIVILGASCLFTPTPITVDLIDFPQINTPTAYLKSASQMFPWYGTFGKFEIVTKSNETIEHRRKTEPEPEETSFTSNTSRRSTIISNLSISIPSSTTSIWGETHIISYKIIIKTESDRWTIRRQYSDFVSLHEELPSVVRQTCSLPSDHPKRAHLSWNKVNHKPLHLKLEKYLQSVVHHRSIEPLTCQALCCFLEIEYMEPPFGLFESQNTFYSPINAHQHEIDSNHII